MIDRLIKIDWSGRWTAPWKGALAAWLIDYHEIVWWNPNRENDDD